MNHRGLEFVVFDKIQNNVYSYEDQRKSSNVTNSNKHKETLRKARKQACNCKSKSKCVFSNENLITGTRTIN